MTSRTVRASAGPSGPARTGSRPALIADTAIRLLAERGLRGLTHRAVDEAAGLPAGSTSNHARTRAALLEAAVRQLALRDTRVFGAEIVTPDGPEDLARAVARTVHRYLTEHPDLLLARYELALEATRRPELRPIYDAAGKPFRDVLTALLARWGSAEPERHALSLVAWADGVMFACAAGPYHAAGVTPEQLRAGCGELLRGMLGDAGHTGGKLPGTLPGART
ncbi:TetR/AcrR family transcriptional regulator [Streptomyces sp. bgisy100]|uniref:TetR/AcrR family transcriptional regulator n=1 Tax=Streptomyces sp. bgisy100 TaxID=3413783 RepID=UPI003D723752